MPEFTHINGDKVQMVDITTKDEVKRMARAEGTITLRADTLAAIRAGTVLKGNVLATARIAATLAVKQTPQLIPLCHQIPIGAITVNFSEGERSITAEVTVTSYGRTGVEMEALTGVSVALLTIWDMVKSAEKDKDGQYPVTGISDIRVIEKRKG